MSKLLWDYRGFRQLGAVTTLKNLEPTSHLSLLFDLKLRRVNRKWSLSIIFYAFVTISLLIELVCLVAWHYCGWLIWMFHLFLIM